MRTDITIDERTSNNFSSMKLKIISRLCMLAISCEVMTL